jgi:hypothetical protein
MSGLIGQDQQEGLIPQDQKEPRVFEAGSAPAVEAPEKSAGRGRRRLASPSNLRLALLVVFIVMIGTGAGFAASLLVPTQYAARAVLGYNLPKTDNPDVFRVDPRLTTEMARLRSRAVLDPVAFDMGVSPDDLAKRISATVVDDSHMVEVEAHAGTGPAALQLLTSVITQYQTQSAFASHDNPIVTYLEFRLSEVRQKEGLPGYNAADLRAQENFLHFLLDGVPPNPVDPQSVPGQFFTVVDPPYMVSAPIQPKPRLGAAAGATTGLVVAAIVILVAARRRLRS